MISNLQVKEIHFCALEIPNNWLELRFRQLLRDIEVLLLLISYRYLLLEVNTSFFLLENQSYLHIGICFNF